MQFNFLEYYGCSELAYHEGLPGLDIRAYRDGQSFGVYVTMEGKDLHTTVLGVNRDRLTDAREFAHYFNSAEGELTVHDHGLSYSVVRPIESPKGEHVKIQFENAVLDLHAIPNVGVSVSEVQELDLDDADDAPTSNFI